MQWFGISSYAIVAVAYGAMAILLMASHPSRLRGSMWVPTIAVSSLWAGGIVLLLGRGAPPLPALMGLDAAHLFVWTVCVSSWLEPSSARHRLLAASAVFGIGAPLAVSELSPLTTKAGYAALVAVALVGLLAVEQVFRNAQQSQRESLRMLCLTAGGIFVLDLFLYAQATLWNGLVPVLWVSRGIANALLLPLIVLAIKNQSEWKRELFFSRQVVFYTASLMGVGVYLLAMGLAAYVLYAVGGEWTFVLELLFLLMGIGVLAFALFAATIQMRLKTFLVKHFYKNKYDYREEWLRLTQSLGRFADLRLLAQSGLESLARIIGSSSGGLWLARDSSSFEWTCGVGPFKVPQSSYDRKHPIVEFLASTFWVIDAQEYAREPDLYQTAFGDPESRLLPPDSIIVPLDCQRQVQGFVILEKSPEIGALNFEDHDILKTAGQQLAMALAQALALEKLAETRQFEAMNKMTTFLMHDLKNILAQQQLVVDNAARFRHRPEFFDDAIATIHSGVDRMKKVLEQLQSRRLPDRSGGRTDVSKVLMEVRSNCADRDPVPEIDSAGTPIWLSLERDKLTSMLTHLVRNAQDATPATGQVRIGVAQADRELVFTVSDTGSGMDQTFIRDRLFRPFDSTKGAHGMGIGAYQVRDIARSAGGDVEVTSEPNVGTTFRLRLPLSEPVSDADSAGRPAAQV
jgi:putative PEP-CTERM system histidine kinase